MDQDIDDAFWAASNIQYELIEKGRDLGKSTGLERKKEESYKLGFQNGSDFAQEIGYYYGIVETIEEMQNAFGLNEDKNARVKILIKDIKDLINEAKTSDAFDETINDKVDKIRSKFKVLASMIKLKVFQKDDQW